VAVVLSCTLAHNCMMGKFCENPDCKGEGKPKYYRHSDTHLQLACQDCGWIDSPILIMDFVKNALTFMDLLERVSKINAVI
jgi:hypothetical protein